MNLVNNNPEQGLSIDFGSELSKNLTIHTNVKQELIVTTTDKIKLVLNDTEKIMLSKREWWTPLGLLLSFVATLCTVEFKETLNLSKDFWQAMFVFFLLSSLAWLAYTVIKLIKYWRRSSVEKIIEQIKLRNDESK